MKFKVGDKVKFLNENGGGVISKIISPSMVNVAIEDGFEIPILTSEILKIELDAPMDSPKHLFTEDFNVKVDQTPDPYYESDERNIPLLSNSAKGNLEHGIYLAFVPHDQKWLITGMIDIYLVNHTNYDILYSYFLEKESSGFIGKDYGSATAESMVLLGSVDREGIEKWTKGVVQVLFHSDKSEGVLSPGNSNFKVKPSRFYQENSYKDSALINGKAIIISLIPLSAQTFLFNNEVIEKDEPAELIVREAKEVKPEHIIDKHKTSPREAVVDLHIYELVDHESFRDEKIDDSQKLRIQINYFIRCLESAIANSLYKVTFIHGVGTGVLKTTIKEILKDYPNVEIRDASMKQFGYGATEVVIK